MKTFYELKTLPKVGDLIMKEGGDGWGRPVVVIVTKIIGNAYYINKTGQSMHRNYLSAWYCPLEQEGS